MPGSAPSDREQVRAAELLAGISLATDLGRGFPLEHGLQSTLVAIRLCDRLGVDRRTTAHVYFGCLLFYVGCTADAEVAAELFDEGMLGRHVDPVLFGSPGETIRGVARALGGTGVPPVRAARAARRLPTALRGHRRHAAAFCEVGRMLASRVGTDAEVAEFLGHATERWDGRGQPGGLRGEQLPMPLRIIHVARDATYQQLLGGPDHAVRITAERAGHAFDPVVVDALVTEPATLEAAPGTSCWPAVLAAEPDPHRLLGDAEIDRALAAVADFADLVSPYLAGHSSGVAVLAAAAGRRCNLPEPAVRDLWRAGAVHDLGRVALSARMWQQGGVLSADQWERVRLHAYFGERVLSRSAFLRRLLPIAASHHERLDGSGYHRGTDAADQTPAARILAAADAYHAMIEPRPHRQAFTGPAAAEELRGMAAVGRLDHHCVAAVLAAAGQETDPVPSPGDLTPRETQVLTLLARGLQIKQVARALGISGKTADNHVQHVYAKIGVSTRAAAAVFAMEHGLLQWGELPIPPAVDRS